jgi:hypothetical protein
MVLPFPFYHLKTETEPVSETLWILLNWTMDNVQINKIQKGRLLETTENGDQGTNYMVNLWSNCNSVHMKCKPFYCITAHTLKGTDMETKCIWVGTGSSFCDRHFTDVQWGHGGYHMTSISYWMLLRKSRVTVVTSLILPASGTYTEGILDAPPRKKWGESVQANEVSKWPDYINIF